MTVSIDVQNTGKLTGDQVVQLYTHQRSGSSSRPVRELKGFRRITLKPGETPRALMRIQLHHLIPCQFPRILDINRHRHGLARLH